MIKILRIVRLLIIQQLFTVVLIFSVPTLFAQGLPEIPTEWPISIRNELSSSAELVKKHFKEYDKKIDAYNSRCGDGKVPLNDKQLIAACAEWSNALDKEAELLVKEKANYLAKFNDYDRIWKAHVQTKKNEQRVLDKIYPHGKPVGPSEKNVEKNPDLTDVNVDLSEKWGGSTGNPPDLPKDLNDRNIKSEQKLAKKYPEFDKILKKETELKDAQFRLKKVGVTLYKEIKGKGSTATQEDWDKLKKITIDLEKVNQNLTKTTEQKEKAKKDYKVSDPF